MDPEARNKKQTRINEQVVTHTLLNQDSEPALFIHFQINAEEKLTLIGTEEVE